MRKSFRFWPRRLFGCFALVIVVMAVGPRPDVSQTPAPAPNLPEGDLDAWLREREGAVQGLRSNAVKQIVWADEPGQVTPWSLVYVHGFSASKAELRPVPDRIAERCGANLFFTRLAGHGLAGESLAETSAQQWLADVKEAVQVGSRLGERVILMGTSTGATLAAWAALQSELREQIGALILVAPNFAVQGAPTWLLNFPWMQWLLPELLGKTRETQPISFEHANAWTTRYPMKAIFPMAAMLRIAESLPYESAAQPALFIYSGLDQVVDPAATRRVISRWGGRVSLLRIDQSEDKNHHVIAGDIRSPSTTGIVVAEVVRWLQGDAQLAAAPVCAGIGN